MIEAFLTAGAVVRVGETALAFEREQEAVELTPSRATSFGKLLGESLEMRRIYPLAERLAPPTCRW